MLAAQACDALDHHAIGHHLQSTEVERFSVCGLLAANAKKHGENIAECDRLGRDRDPTGADDQRQPVDERKDRLEGGASGTDDHRGSQCGHRNRSGCQDPGRLGSAPKMRREIGRSLAEPAEIHDLSRAGRRSGCCDRGCSGPIERFEVTAAE